MNTLVLCVMVATFTPDTTMLFPDKVAGEIAAADQVTLSPSGSVAAPVAVVSVPSKARSQSVPSADPPPVIVTVTLCSWSFVTVAILYQPAVFLINRPFVPVTKAISPSKAVKASKAVMFATVAIPISSDAAVTKTTALPDKSIALPELLLSLTVRVSVPALLNVPVPISKLLVPSSIVYRKISPVLAPASAKLW